MKVSVIIPAYNAEAWIERCIESILAQTHTDLEICIVDDCSTDSTVAKIQGFTDERIRLEQGTANVGCGLARRRAIAMGTGEVFAFVDADDYIEPQMFAEMLSAMETENADIAICGTFIHEEGKYKGQRLAETYYTAEKEQLYREYMDGLWIMQYNGNKLYKRHLMDEIVYCDYRFCEDSVTTFQWLWKANKAVVLPVSYYHYWKHGDSNSQTRENWLHKSLCTIRCVNLHFDFCMEQGFYDVLPRLVQFAYLHLVNCIKEFPLESAEYAEADEIRQKFLSPLPEIEQESITN